MTDIGRHGRNIAWLALADLFGKACGVFYFAYLSRSLSVIENGWYGTFIAAIPILSTLNTLGFQDIVTRETSRDRGRVHALMGSGMATQLGLFVVLLPAVWGVSVWLGYDPSLRFVIALAALAALERALISMHAAVIAAHERFKYASIVAIFTRSATVAGGIGLLYLGYGLKGILCFTLGVFVMELLLTYVAVRRKCVNYRLVYRLSDVRFLLREGSGMASGRLVSVLYYSMDMFVLNALVSGEEVGYFAVGTRFLALLWTFPDLLESVSYPILSRKALEGEASQHFAFLRLVKGMTLIGFPMACGMSALSEGVVATLCGAKFIPGAAAAAVLTWVLALEMLMRIPTVYLRARSCFAAVTRCYALGVAIKLPLAWLLVPRLGVNSFLAISVLASCIMSVVIFRSVRSVLPALFWREVFVTAGKPLIAAIAMAAMLWPMRDLSVFLTVPAGAIGYGVVFAALGGIDPFDLSFLRQLLVRKGGREAA
ncbi:MAG TPA: oligosaccharide flippase family protein [Candidatus Hydrogenedentes bacterium]|nr:oligosaccharide flippase family protein [Candidatus Hydrogenedentota bacterium]